jgi:hypothetical protein
MNAGSDAVCIGTLLALSKESFLPNEEKQMILNCFNKTIAVEQSYYQQRMKNILHHNDDGSQILFRCYDSHEKFLFREILSTDEIINIIMKDRSFYTR